MGTSRVLIVSGSVGAGHGGAAHELAARLERAGAEVSVRDFLDAVPSPVAALLREGYLAVVDRCPSAFECLFQRLERRRLFWPSKKHMCPHATATIGRSVAESRPDAVVATSPPASQPLGV